jgi:MOSC domain-containing protein YiiM
MYQPVLLSIQVGRPAEHGTDGAADPMDCPWTSGFFKAPVAGPISLGRTNLDGDGQEDLVNHGGPDKAVCVYSADHYDTWRHELELPGLTFGAFGENFTIGGMDEDGVCIGDVWRVGEATVQVSQPRQPCWKLARRWRIKDLPGRVVATGRTGWYFRVLEEGVVSPELPMALVERPFPSWTVGRANRVMHHDRGDRRAAAELAAVPPLSASWREALARRAGS